MVIPNGVMIRLFCSWRAQTFFLEIEVFSVDSFPTVVGTRFKRGRNKV